MIPVLSRITGVNERCEIAETAAEAALSSPSTTPFLVISVKLGLALIAVLRDDAAAAAEHYVALQPHRATMAVWTQTSFDRLLGLLVQTISNLDRAADHFEDALAFCRKSDRRPELAWTCHDYAQTLIQRSGPDDRPKVSTLLEESLTLSTTLGMRPLMKRVIALQEKVGSQPSNRPAYPDALTAREVEVRRLISGWRTDREIAEVIVSHSMPFQM